MMLAMKLDDGKVRVVEADLDNHSHAAGVVACIDAYALHPMGGATPLPEDVKAGLIPGLKAHPAKLVLLALHAQEPVGVAVCFFGFSTFAARPRLNVHDLSVLPAYRGRGIGRSLLETVIDCARKRGCCGVTLEVRADNEPAKHLYKALGFSDWLAPLAFWERKL